MITVSCEVTKVDVLAFACHYYAESPTVRRQLRTNQMVTSLSSGALVFLWIWKASGFVAGVVMFFLIGGAVAAMLPKYYRSNIGKTTETSDSLTAYTDAMERGLALRWITARFQKPTHSPTSPKMQQPGTARRKSSKSKRPL